jgi:hypothetical protein
MRHADALSRNINVIDKSLVLSREIIREEQEKDSACFKYKQAENFWTDEDGILYHLELRTVSDCYSGNSG